MKLWIRTQKGEKILNSVTVDIPAVPDADSLTALLRETLMPLDVPTPAVLASHAVHLNRFNLCRFKKADFVEHVDFDSMTIEIMRGEKEKRGHKRNPLDEA